MIAYTETDPETYEVLRGQVLRKMGGDLGAVDDRRSVVDHRVK
jgi:hypothetical protein